MIIGDPAEFAIESTILQTYTQLSLRALGSFTLHIQGYRYGVMDADATCLACSFDEVASRIGRRGKHTASFGSIDARAIAIGVRESLYAHVKDDYLTTLGLTRESAANELIAHRFLWAPDGDAAFDDGSFVVQMDLNEAVRLVAFKSVEGSETSVSEIRDLTMPGSRFYEILQDWHRAFECEWRAALRR